MQKINLDELITQISREKNIDKEVLVEMLEDAILGAAKKQFGKDRKLEARYNPATGEVELYLILDVTENETIPGVCCSVEDARKHGIEAEPGQELVFRIYYHDEEEELAKQQTEKYGDLLDIDSKRSQFGRIAVHEAKNFFKKRLMDAEQESIYREFKAKEGEIVTGTVRRFYEGSIIVSLGRTEAILPPKEQVPTESYRPGEKITALVLKVTKDEDPLEGERARKDRRRRRRRRGTYIILSRRSIDFVKKLFEMEVPEIYQKIVTIEAIARDPGSKTKVAVSSNDRDVDPVGACVGVKGERVKNISMALKGEKVDVIPYDPDPVRYVCNAIAPAQVSKVIVAKGEKVMDLIIPDNHLSLAIGAKGQNVKLASQLTGWTINIYSESKVRQEEEYRKKQMASIEGVGEELAETLYKLGWRSVEDIAKADPEELAKIPGLGGIERAREITAAASEKLEELREHDELMYEEELVESIGGLDEETFRALQEAGIEDLNSLVMYSPDQLAEMTGFSVDRAEEVIEKARLFLEKLGERTEELEEEEDVASAVEADLLAEDEEDEEE